MIDVMSVEWRNVQLVQESQCLSDYALSESVELARWVWQVHVTLVWRYYNW